MPKKQSVKVKNVELYLNECFPCNSKKYGALYDWLLEQNISLHAFRTNRIPLSREWLDFARSIKQTKNIEAPFIVVYGEDDKQYIFEYQQFMKEGKKMFSKEKCDEIRKNIMTKNIEKVEEVKQARKTKTKKTTVKKEEVISADIEE